MQLHRSQAPNTHTNDFSENRLFAILKRTFFSPFREWFTTMHVGDSSRISAGMDDTLSIETANRVHDDDRECWNPGNKSSK